MTGLPAGRLLRCNCLLPAMHLQLLMPRVCAQCRQQLSFGQHTCQLDDLSCITWACPVTK